MRMMCATTARKGGPDGHLKQPCCAGDEGRSLEAGGRAQASNHRKLHLVKSPCGERCGTGGTYRALHNIVTRDFSSSAVLVIPARVSGAREESLKCCLAG
jgi:hypothetical protein